MTLRVYSFFDILLGIRMKIRFPFKLSGVSLAVATALFVVSTSYAADTISNIQIRGLNRVTKGAVLLALPLREGDMMSQQNVAMAMQRLYATGEFEDVSISHNNGTLIIDVKERPTVGKIEFSGNSGVKTDDLKKVIADEGIRAGEPLNNQALNSIEKSLEDFYHSSGLYQASVKAVITNLPRNRADIKIEIIEGVPAKIKQINIVGNKSFDEDVLLAKMSLRDDIPWWNFLAENNYSGQKMTADLESLKSYYMDRGFVNFRIEGTSVELTPDKKGIYLTINVNEGDCYKISGTTLAGDTLKHEEELKQVIDIEKDDVYNQHKVTVNEKNLAGILGKYGYANTVVKAVPIFDEEHKTVELQFNVMPGKRVHVSQIFITGNSVTDDVVIRRELRQMDGTWLSTEAIETSKARLNRLGYFETVDINTENLGGTQDTVNVTTKITERPTGSISGGIGYGSDSGMALQLGVSQTNLFGWGKVGAISAYKNKYRRHAEISYTDPYFTVDNISLGGRIFYDRYYGADDYSTVDYRNRTIGLFSYLGYPLSEKLGIRYSLGVEKNQLENRGRRFQQGDKFYEMYSKNYDPNARFPDQKVNLLNYKAGIDLTYTTLNQKVFPTKGSQHILSLMATVPGSDAHYYKATAETYNYFPLTEYHDYVFGIRGKIGYGNGYQKKNGKTEYLPFYDNFNLGGSQWLRGFKRNAIGPRALYRNPLNGNYYESNTSVGGNAFWAASAEFIFPLPFIAEAYRNSIRTSIFFDAGSLWDSRSKDYAVDYSKPGKYRTSAGISLTWMSPLGPLTFSLAKALKKEHGDDTQVFNFDIGGTF